MIREAKKKELGRIAEMYEKIMAREFLQIGERPITKDEYRKILEKNYGKKPSFMFVLDEKGIKGFLWFVKKGKEINLEEIFVLEKRKGHGRKLLDFLIKKAKENKIKRINLDVHFKNRKAINFFKKFNFRPRTIEMSLDLD
jgi:GNAT superfamily N-acetyltransferase